MKNEKTQTKKKIDGLTVILVIMIIITISVLALRIIGFQTFSVTSSSMFPALEVGDVVVVKPVDFEDLKVDDVVTFRVQGRNSSVASTITHRIVSIDTVNKAISTRGDKNEAIDGTPILYGNVIGKVVFRLPGFGGFFSYFASTAGKIMLISTILLVFVLIVFFTDRKKESSSDPDDGNLPLNLNENNQADGTTYEEVKTDAMQDE